MSLDARWAEILCRLRDEGRHRELTPPRGIDFSSNDYLGYAAGHRLSAVGEEPRADGREPMAGPIQS